MEKEKLNEVLCTECAETKLENEFYKRFIETESHEIKNTSCVFVKYQGVCKECLIKEFQASLENFKGDVKEAIKYICSKYDLPYDEQLIKNNTSKTGELKNYIKDISILKQYENKGFDDECTIVKNKELSSKDIAELDAIDFLELDIKNIKIKMINSLKKDDVNAHGKWMNSLRDALQLKDKLESNIGYSVKKLDLKDNDIIVLNMDNECTLDKIEFEVSHINELVNNKIITVLPNIEMSILSR